MPTARNLALALSFVLCTSAAQARPRFPTRKGLLRAGVGLTLLTVAACASQPSDRGPQSLAHALPSHQLGAEVELWRKAFDSAGPKQPSKIDRDGYLRPIFDWLRSVPVAADREELARDVAQAERAWGREIPVPERGIPDRLIYKAELAAALKIFGRTPADFTPGFLHVPETQLEVPKDIAAQSGLTDPSVRIASRDLFYTVWKPLPGVKPSKVVWVVSPGYDETGRNYFEQIQALNARGDSVLVFDQQWAGYTQSNGSFAGQGKVDRGFGVARDVLAATMAAEAIARAQHGPGAIVLHLGTSMGAGPGLYGAAALLNGLTKVDLHLSGRVDGVSLGHVGLPGQIRALFESPYFTYTLSFKNEAEAVAAHIPGLQSLPLPGQNATEANPDARHQLYALQGDRAGANGNKERAQALTASQADLKVAQALLAARSTAGRFAVIGATNDELAQPAATRDYMATLGGVHFTWLPSSDHPLPNDATKLNAVLADRAYFLGEAPSN